MLTVTTVKTTDSVFLVTFPKNRFQKQRKFFFFFFLFLTDPGMKIAP